MFFKELFQQLEIDLLVARSGGLTSRKVGGWRNDREDALVFVGEFRDELDEWPEEYPGSYEEFIYGLGAIRLDDIEGSTLSPEWKENAREGIVYYLLARMSEIHTHYILPPRSSTKQIGR